MEQLDSFKGLICDFQMCDTQILTLGTAHGFTLIAGEIQRLWALCLTLTKLLPQFSLAPADELWMEVHDIAQERGIKTIPMEKKCKKAKWLSEETLQIAEKRREAKGKGEKERYTHLNTDFQTKARRDKKASLSDQCKEIEENNRM